MRLTLTNILQYARNTYGVDVERRQCQDHTITKIMFNDYEEQDDDIKDIQDKLDRAEIIYDYDQGEIWI